MMPSFTVEEQTTGIVSEKRHVKKMSSLLRQNTVCFLSNVCIKLILNDKCPNNRVKLNVKVKLKVNLSLCLFSN